MVKVCSRWCSMAEDCNLMFNKVAVLFDDNEDGDGDVDNDDDDDDEDCLTKQKIAVFFSAQQAGSNCKIEATSKNPYIVIKIEQLAQVCREKNSSRLSSKDSFLAK